jgi:hypothetical protein
MKNQEIFLNLAVEKDPDSDAIYLQVGLHRQAPNVQFSDHTVCWRPTWEELEFLTKAFSLFLQAQPPAKACATTHNSLVNFPHDVALNRPMTQLPQASGMDANMKPVDPKPAQTESHTIDDILNRKNAAHNEEIVFQCGDKALVDRVLRKKKE